MEVAAAKSLGTVIKLAIDIGIYLKKVHDAPKVKNGLLTQVTETQALLEKLKNGGAKEIDIIQDVNSPVQRLFLALSATEAALKPRTFGSWTWPFEEEQAKDMLEMIEREKNNLQIAMAMSAR
jgi:hypothetical protein